MKQVFILTLLFFLVAAGPGFCQTGTYHIGPRDVLSVSIHAGGVAQEKIDVTVSEHGKINVPFIGSIKAEGLTLTELEDAIQTPLAQDYFVNPQVNVQVKEYHSISFFISGAVKKPGQYEMTSVTNFLELVSRAEGLLKDRGSIAYVLREIHGISTEEDVKKAIKNNATIKVDLTQLLDEGDMSHNITLVPGDIVYIPRADKLNQSVYKIYVEGEVKKPGVYDYQPGMTAMAACVMAGGFDKYAAISRVKIVRNENGKQEVIKVNLEKVQDGRTPDIPIKPGDHIHIPETWL
ncbi:polysaccharide biosynthesis/export family protein [Desulfobacter curvatus]|uniref:polysaccharide biosynthesis/export family protein n=1 Tax=Desulfobacter curvatus TaxID=2290 RepID=UPI00036FF513|nr:polysaccharide biosynthesis/export family protein [Desulfobacter curvatus]